MEIWAPSEKIRQLEPELYQILEQTDQPPEDEIVSSGRLNLWPHQCFSCGEEIGHHQEAYEFKLSQNITPREAMDQLGLKKYCCRSLALSAPTFDVGRKHVPKGIEILNQVGLTHKYVKFTRRVGTGETTLDRIKNLSQTSNLESSNYPALSNLQANTFPLPVTSTPTGSSSLSESAWILKQKLEQELYQTQPVSIDLSDLDDLSDLKLIPLPSLTLSLPSSPFPPLPLPEVESKPESQLKVLTRATMRTTGTTGRRQTRIPTTPKESITKSDFVTPPSFLEEQ